jgi:hypothetical protein
MTASAEGLALWRGARRFRRPAARIVKVSALQCLEPDWNDASLAAILAPITERFGPDAHVRRHRLARA